MPGFEDTIEALVAHQRLKPSQIRQLSGLASEQLRQLRGVWSTLPDPERMNLLASLRRHAEENTLTDFDAIYQTAMDDPNGDVRRVAVTAVLGNRDLGILAKMLELCASDPDEIVRATAADRLGGFAFEAEAGSLPDEMASQIERVLLERVQSETEAPNVRAQALTSVGYFSTEQVRQEIRRALARETLRVAAIRAIGHNLDPEWTEVLTEQMASRDPAIRQEAAEAAADYDEAVDALTDLVDDPVVGVRLAAISSLGKIGSVEARDALIYCFESDDPVIKKAATEALREIESIGDPLATAGPEWDDQDEEESS